MADRKRIVRVDFYQVDLGKQATLFETVLSAAHAAKPDRRTQTVSQVPIRLQSLTDHTTHLTGELMRIEMNDIPLLGKLDGTTSAIELDEDQGVADTSAFLFLPSHNLLVLERNRRGVTSGHFAGYFEQIGNVPHIALLPVVSKEGLEALLGMKTIRSMEVDVAPVNFDGALSPTATSSETYLPKAKKLEAKTMTISYGMGYTRGELKRDAVVEAVKKLLGVNKASNSVVNKVDIHGRGPDGVPTVLDILSYHITHRREFKVDEGNRVSLAKRLELLQDALNTHKEHWSKVGTSDLSPLHGLRLMPGV